jgi:hypothetical protein
LQVWVAQNPPGFAFVEYERESDAEEAVRQMNGNSIPGTSAKLRVEHSRYVSIGLILEFFYPIILSNHLFCELVVVPEEGVEAEVADADEALVIAATASEVEAVAGDAMVAIVEVEVVAAVAIVVAAVVVAAVLAAPEGPTVVIEEAEVTAEAEGVSTLALAVGEAVAATDTTVTAAAQVVDTTGISRLQVLTLITGAEAQ